jgi:two-component system, cell cycle response regulator
MSSLHRILVIDDDEAVRCRVRDLLEQDGGFIVEEAADGQVGLERAAVEPPDLILLDLMMPGASGLDVCAALRGARMTRDVPVIILSAINERETLVRAIDAGAEDFLPKPVNGAELLAKVRTIARLDRRRSLQRERRRLLWLVDQSHEALVLVGLDGRVLHANTRGREMFGLSAHLGDDFVAAVQQHFRSDPPDAWDRLRADGFKPGPAFAIHQPETSQLAARWFSVDLCAEPDDSDGLLLLKFTDKSGVVRRELETWTFQHLISHKLRTPLSGLSGLLSFIAGTDHVRDHEETAQLLAVVLRNAQRLEDVLLSILRYHEARFAARRPAIDGAPVPVVDEIAMAATEAGLARDRLRISGATEMLVTAEARDALNHALVEIIGNYAFFSAAPDSGLTVEMDWMPNGEGRARMRLFAPGPALPPDAVQLLGRPYWQLESRFSGEVPGIGLGLATARVLLQGRGGDLSFAGRTDPSGLETTLLFPATQPC